ncbi:MAG: TPM domain-containing protein [Nitrospirae bacterium]|nr:TPM domain-containing protein [Nitrospirota bacterium]
MSYASIITLALTLACPLAALALDVPPLTGRIVDVADLLPADLETTLSADLQAHEMQTTNQVAVLTVPSLQGDSLEDFSHRVATTWALGHKGTDNGVLILVIPDDRKVRIEVGYGLEGTLTDARASRIIRQEMVPKFRTGDYAGGITAGVTAVLGTIQGTYSAPAESAQPAGPFGAHPLLLLIFPIFIGVVFGTMAGLSSRGGIVVGGLVTFFSALQAGLLWAAAGAGLTLLFSFFLAQAAAGLEPQAGARGRTRSGLDSGWTGGWSGGGGFSGSGGGFSGGGGDFGGGGASGQW